MRREFETVVTLRVVMRGHEEIEDGITNHELYKIVNAIQESCLVLVENELVCFDIEDIECECVELIPPVQLDESPRSVPVPDDCWLDWDGHRWVTDGCVLIRADVPLPMYNPKDPERYWQLGDISAIKKVVGPEFDRADRNELVKYPKRTFANRFAGLLKYGDCVVGSPNPQALVIIRKNGENVAVVMPLSHDSSHESEKHGKHVDSYGDELA